MAIISPVITSDRIFNFLSSSLSDRFMIEMCWVGRKYTWYCVPLHLCCWHKIFARSLKKNQSVLHLSWDTYEGRIILHKLAGWFFSLVEALLLRYIFSWRNWFFEELKCWHCSFYVVERICMVAFNPCLSHRSLSQASYVGLLEDEFEIILP